MKPIFVAALFMVPSLLFAQKAETIVFNAKIHTLNDSAPYAEALAIAKGKIIRIGKKDVVMKTMSKQTKLIDAQNNVLIPGLFDSHLHVIRGGRFFNSELRWDGVKSLKTALQMLKEQAERTPEGQWVRVVGGWNAYQFEEKRMPTLVEINQATGKTPAFILYLYGHAYLNKAGLEKLQINESTSNPPGGLIEKDRSGKPTGLLIAEPNAYLLYSTLAKLPDLSKEEQLNSTKQFMKELNRFGITSAMDAGGGFQNYPDDYQISNALATNKELTIRIPFFLFAQKAGKEFVDYQKWIQTIHILDECEEDSIKNATQYNNYHVKGGGENLVMSAADFENFDQPRPELSPAMESQLKQVLTLLISNKWPFRIHATYNESISRFLNVLEDINQTIPLNNLIWFIAHAETISEANLLRLKKLGGGIAIQHRMAFQGESFIRRYGLDAAGNTPPIKRMLELGIPVGMGSDGTRVSSYNPFIGLFWLTTGRTIGHTRHLADSNLLDRTTALKLYTKGSAQLIKIDNHRGMLKEGYDADFCLLNEDYFSIEASKILDLESILTVMGGNIVYAAEQFDFLQPNKLAIIPNWSPVHFYGGYQKN